MKPDMDLSRLNLGRVDRPTRSNGGGLSREFAVNERHVEAVLGLMEKLHTSWLVLAATPIA